MDTNPPKFIPLRYCAIQYTPGPICFSTFGIIDANINLVVTASDIISNHMILSIP